MKQYFSKILIFLIIFALFASAKPLFAASINYASILDSNATSVIVKYGSLETKSVFSCTISNFSCKKSSSSSLAYPTVAKNPVKQTVYYDAQKTHAVGIAKNPGAETYTVNSYNFFKSTKPISTAVLPFPAKPTKITWSDDSTHVLFGYPSYTIYNGFRILDLATGTFSSEYYFTVDTPAALTISSLGNYIAYYTGTKSNEAGTRTYYLYDLKNNKQYSNTVSVPYWDLVGDQPRLFSFAPDESSLVYVGDQDGSMSLYRVDLKSLPADSATFGGQKVSLIKGNVADFFFVKNTSLLVVSNDTNPYTWSLRSVDFTKNTVSIIRNNVSYVAKMRQVGSNILINALKNNSSVPVAYNFKTGAVRFFASFPLSTTTIPGTREVFQTADEYGVLIKPKTITVSTPLLIWLHGGPYRQTSFGYHPYASYGVYDWMLDEAVKSGAIVLKLDYRGSQGYGSAYASSIKGEVGRGDVGDVVNAEAALRSKMTFGKTYLVGNSYGGYLSLKSIVEHPETFRGALSINGVTDWADLLVNIKTSIFNIHFAGVPSLENQALYDQASIINKVANLGDNPIIVAQGTADQTVDPSQAPLITGVLNQVHKNVTLVEYKGSDHVFSTKAPLEDLCKRLIKLSELTLAKGMCVFK
jgi:dipeptidyl aminopeptidase/acylaminoacyl peptidase